MVETVYYGLYKSTTIQQTGCNKQLLSVPQNELAFPPRIWVNCPRCMTNHTFSYDKSFAISTASQKDAIYKWATETFIEVDCSLENN